ncbi:hypothetical protein AB5I41_06505 [Sphingomonas sp. MMS24-JH45]
MAGIAPPRPSRVRGARRCATARLTPPMPPLPPEEAEDAVLDNVPRDRALRSEAAWAQMAQRSRKTEASRDAREGTAARRSGP